MILDINQTSTQPHHPHPSTVGPPSLTLSLTFFQQILHTSMLQIFTPSLEYLHSLHSPTSSYKLNTQLSLFSLLHFGRTTRKETRKKALNCSSSSSSFSSQFQVLARIQASKRVLRSSWSTPLHISKEVFILDWRSSQEHHLHPPSSRKSYTHCEFIFSISTFLKLL